MVYITLLHLLSRHIKFTDWSVFLEWYPGGYVIIHIAKVWYGDQSIFTEF